MTQVRLRLAAFANMTATLLRITASLLFIVVVARRLGIDGFAALGIILSLYQAIPMLTHIWHWWAQRQVGEYSGAQARIAAGTGLTLTLIAAPLGALTYAAIAWGTMRITGLQAEAALLAGPAVALYMVARYLNGIIAVRRPELVGSISLVHEVAKLAAALALVVGMGWGLRGAVLSLDIAALSMLLAGLYIYTGLGFLHLYLDREKAVYWLRMWRLPVSLLLLTLSQSLVRPVYTWLTGLLRPVAYLNMALSVVTPLARVGQSVVPGLYARALRRGGVGDLEESIRIYLLFLVYVVALVAGASKPLASAFNPEYMDGHSILALGVLYAFAVGMTSSYRTYILGSTSTEGLGYWRLNRLVTLEIIIFLSGLVIGAILSREASTSWGAAVIYMAVASLARLAPLPLYHRIVAREGFRFPWVTLAETSLGGLGAWLLLRLSGVEEIVVRELLVDGPRLALYVVASAAVYIGVVLLVSPWARDIASRGLRLVARRVAF